MALDLEDQEQLDEFKVWWNQYGKLVIAVLIAGLLAYSLWTAYQYSKHQKAVEASEIYQTLSQLDPSKADELKAAATTLTSDYAGTPYAGRAAVMQARSQFVSGDVSGAKEQLTWAIANAQETAVKAIASLQLARILLDNKDYAGAEKVLSVDMDPGYVGLKSDLQGDILLAQGKEDEAKKMYSEALLNLDTDGRLYVLTKQKLESLGR